MFYPVTVTLHTYIIYKARFLYYLDEKFNLSSFRIESIETNNGKMLAKTETCCGKLSVKLTNGEELLGKNGKGILWSN